MNQMPQKAKRGGARAPRLKPDDREAAILKGAESFFAEHGFDAPTRDLAKHLGVTQPLLYRYFPTKHKLIEQVYNDIFVKRWDPSWKALITDRNLPLIDRLESFYLIYRKATLTRDWMRIFFFAGLKGYDFNFRYLRMLQREVFIPICCEIRAAHGLDSCADQVTAAELETVYSFHGGIIYRGIREHIYGLTVQDEPELVLRAMLHALTEDVATTMYREIAAQRTVSSKVQQARGSRAGRAPTRRRCAADPPA